MKSNAINDNLMFIANNVINKLAPEFQEYELDISFYSNKCDVARRLFVEGFKYSLDEAMIDNIPHRNTYNAIELFISIPGGDLSDTSLVNDLFREYGEPNDFEKAIIRDYNSTRAEILKYIIANGELPEEICNSAEAKYIATCECTDVVSQELFTNIIKLEKAIYDFDDYIDNYDDRLYNLETVKIGLIIEHAKAKGQTTVSLAFADVPDYEPQYFTLMVIPLEEFYDHDTFVERLTSAFNEYMKPYASMQLDGSSKQESPAMV